ncbi:hypothetical protein HMPREF9151_01622 [Hoylesella saccharolytica F0055]|uniref:Uncharacterized protein n=1 Tax=Hoylesella saccharolytica F0055 TaxID=1127699 RepID=L1N895_9BACT|nr:hypothetical protein HMPREF9151_01622 [Hoylesella saccharolytica F0055]
MFFALFISRRHPFAFHLLNFSSLPQVRWGWCNNKKGERTICAFTFL